MFIVLEGPDCVGKTTQAKLLAQRFRSCGREVLELAFPGKSPAGYAARACMRVGANWDGVSDDRLLPAVLRQSAMIADRYGCIPQIRDCLCHGGIVIADRWTQSGEIYGPLEGVDLEWTKAAQGSLPAADLNILLELSLDRICARLRARGATRDMYEDRSFLRTIVELYHMTWAPREFQKGVQPRGDYPMWRCVDADRDERSIHEAIFALARKELERRERL